MTTQAEQRAEALARAQGGLSTANYDAILQMFMDGELDPHDVIDGESGAELTE